MALVPKRHDTRKNAWSSEQQRCKTWPSRCGCWGSVRALVEAQHHTTDTIGRLQGLVRAGALRDEA